MSGNESEFNCEVCQLSKHVRNTYPFSNNSIYIPFILVYSDVWVPSPTSSLFGFRYFVTIVNNCSRCTWIYLMKTKGEVTSIFHNFHKMVQTQFDTSIKVLHFDNGGVHFFSVAKIFGELWY